MIKPNRRRRFGFFFPVNPLNYWTVKDKPLNFARMVASAAARDAGASVSRAVAMLFES